MGWLPSGAGPLRNLRQSPRRVGGHRGPLAVAVLLLAMAWLSGCWGIAPLERRALIGLVAIDAAPAGGYMVAATIANFLSRPAGAGGGQGGGGSDGAPSMLRSASAPSVAGTVERWQPMSYPRLDLSHVAGVLPSEDVARSGLAPVLDYFSRSPKVAVTPWVLVVRAQSAKAFLSAGKNAPPGAGAVLEQTVLFAAQRSPFLVERVFEFLDRLPLQRDEPLTAGVAVSESATGPTVPLQVTGLALFRQDRLVGWLDGPAALGWFLLHTAARVRATLDAPAGSGTYTFEITRMARRVKVVRGLGGPSLSGPGVGGHPAPGGAVGTGGLCGGSGIDARAPAPGRPTPGQGCRPGRSRRPGGGDRRVRVRRAGAGPGPERLDAARRGVEPDGLPAASGLRPRARNPRDNGPHLLPRVRRMLTPAAPVGAARPSCPAPEERQGHIGPRPMSRLASAHPFPSRRHRGRRPQPCSPEAAPGDVLPLRLPGHRAACW